MASAEDPKCSKLFIKYIFQGSLHQIDGVLCFHKMTSMLCENFLLAYQRFILNYCENYVGWVGRLLGRSLHGLYGSLRWRSEVYCDVICWRELYRTNSGSCPVDGIVVGGVEASDCENRRPFGPLILATRAASRLQVMIRSDALRPK